MVPAGVIVLGLVQGSLAALNSLGFVLLWRTNRLVNLAQPSLGLVGGVLVGMLVVSARWSFWFAAPLGLLLGALLALFSDRIVLRRLQDAPRAVLLVATVGLAGIFGTLAVALPFVFKGPLPTYSIELGISFRVSGLLVLGPQILALVALPVGLGATWFFLYRTRLGLAAQALGQDDERARALGVPAALVRSVVWVVAGLLATVSGILSIPALGFSLGGGLGPTVLLLALAPAVLAGLRSLTGAAVGALALGIAFQVARWKTPTSGLGVILLAAAVVVAFAVQRNRLGRAESAQRASSWEAAATPRPLPWAIATHIRVRIAGALLAIAAITCAMLPALLLDAGPQVAYATSAVVALAALSVAVAWMFAGEIVLGHWGFAGLGAAIAAITPGPWAVRCLTATAAVGVGSGLLALAARRRSTLAFPVLGLAGAAAAPVALLQIGNPRLGANPGAFGAAAGAIAVIAAIGVSRLRASGLGVRMVAGRDDPSRARWLGANPLTGRVVGLTLSGCLAGLAGTLYIGALSVLPQTAFSPLQSLELLAMAVIGGLGSPAGALAGAGVYKGAQEVLPPPWNGLATASGVLLVVIFRPAGLSRSLIAVRDRVARALAPARPPEADKPGRRSPVREAVRL